MSSGELPKPSVLHLHSGDSNFALPTSGPLGDQRENGPEDIRKTHITIFMCDIMTYYRSLTHLQCQLKVITFLRSSLIPCSPEPLLYLDSHCLHRSYPWSHIPLWFLYAGPLLSSWGSQCSKLWILPLCSRIYTFLQVQPLRSPALELDKSEFKLIIY